MKLKTLLEYFLELSGERFENGYIGQLLDAKKEKSLGIYLNESDTRIRTIKNSEKPCSFLEVTLLVRYSANYSETEEIAWELYEKIDELKNENVEIGDFIALIILEDEYPIPSIKREGLWEQMIRLRIYYKKKKPVVMFRYIENENGMIGITGFTAEYLKKLINGEVSRELVIPSEFEGKQVTAITSGAFYGNPYIEKVKIENGVTVILRNAFALCTGIRDVYISNSVKQIDPLAFLNCTIETMTIDNTFGSIPNLMPDRPFGASICKKLVYLR